MNKLWTYLILLICTPVFSQQWEHKIEGLPADYSTPKKFQSINKTNHLKQFNGIRNELIENGYLACGIDSILIDDSLKFIQAYFYSGPQLKFAKLESDKADEEVLSSIGFRDKLYSNKPFRPKQLNQLYKSIVKYHENHGHPFASVGLDSISINHSELLAKLSIQKGPQIKVDSIYIKGNFKNHPKMIKNIIGIETGDLFNQEAIDQIGIRIKELAYLKEIKPVEYDFQNEGCNVYLYLENQPASNFNGVIGVQPTDNGELSITGDVKIKLQNALHNGELIDLNWRKLQNQTQDLQSKFNYPYLFNSSFGVDLALKIYRRDTTFNNINSQVGVQYLFSGNNSLTVYYKNQTSNLISTDQYAHLTVLPEFADVQVNSYGLKSHFETLNYRYNPTRGVNITISGNIGNKNIRQNINLNPIAYEGLKLKTIQYSFENQLEFYVPIKQRSTIKLGVKNGMTFNENMFTNELFRIGGNRILRGFDEESIFASSYVVSTIEYRFILEQNSNLFVFFDGGWYESKVQNQFTTDTPMGTGAGISFQTKPGIFSLSYALGSQMGNPFLFRTAKIHFGFVNYF